MVWGQVALEFYDYSVMGCFDSTFAAHSNHKQCRRVRNFRGLLGRKQ